MDTTEKNKIIAEFLGWKIRKMPVYLDGGGDMWMSPHTTSTFCSIYGEELFHRSWDWLMPVVEKIEGLSNDKKIIDWSRQSKTIFDFKLTDSKIEAVYNASVEFIKWYNEQKN